MKNKKLDTIISLSPFLIALLIPVGRYIFGKILKKSKKNWKQNKN